VTAPGNGSSGRFQAQAGPLAVVGLVYAAACGGPYGTEDYVASTGPGLMILLLFLAPWLWGVPIALATAELSSLLPIEGGYYRWTRVILGDFWGFQAGALSLMSSCLDNALYPVLFAKALPLWFPGVFETGLARWLAAVGFIAVLTALNLRGIKLVGGTAVGLNLFLMALLVWFIVAAAFNVRHHPFVPFALSGTRPLGGLGAGLALAIWFYSGYTEISTVCEEIRQPSRTIPLALLIVTPLVVLSYALPTMAGLAVDDGWQAWAAGQFAVIGERLGGKLLGHWLFLASVASFTVIFMSYLLLWSRLGWALAADHKLPSVFARLHPRYGTPYRILMVYAVVYAALAVLSVVYLYRAGNSVARKSGKIPPYHDRVRGTLPWYRTCFSTSWCCWDSCGSASCCIMPGQTSMPEGIRGHPSLCRRRASAPATRSRFLASPACPPVPPVSRPTRPHLNRPVARHPASCPRGDGRARWTPLSTSAPRPTATIGAG
jgi:amino acid transporter